MVYVWDFNDGFDCVKESSSSVKETRVAWREVRNSITAVSLSAKGSTDWMIAVIDTLGQTFVWSSPKKVKDGLFYIGRHYLRGVCPRVAVSPCGHLIASNNWGKVYLWRWHKEKGSHIHTVSWPTYIHATGMTFFPKGKALVAYDAGTEVIPIPGQFTERHENAWACTTRKPSRHDPIASPTLFRNDAVLQSRGKVRFLRRLLPGLHLQPRCARLPNPGQVVAMRLASNKRILVTKSKSHFILV